MSSNYLITGYHGEPHVTPENDRGIHAGIFGTGRFVLPVGEQFKAEYIGNNTIRMYDGKLIDNGAAAGIPAGQYIDFLVPNASQGRGRVDLIIFQYFKEPSTQIENGSFHYVQGVETNAAPQIPDVTQNDILTDATIMIDQMALWKISVFGTEISEPECVFDTTKSLADCASNGYGLGNIATLTSDLDTVNSNGWYFFGASALNRPQHIQYGCLLVVNRSGSEVEQVQLAFSPLDGTKAQRTYRNATDGWSEWEYDNPPFAVGVEYRTTERYNGKAVYTQALQTTWAQGGSMQFSWTDNSTPIRNEANIGTWTLPFLSGGLLDSQYSAFITMYKNGNNLRVSMYGGSNVSGTVTIQVWYTKV